MSVQRLSQMGIAPLLPGLLVPVSRTVTAVASANLDRCFNAGADYYMVTALMTCSGTDRPMVRLRAAGVDAAGAADYTYAWVSATGGAAAAATGSGSSIVPINQTAAAGAMFQIDLLVFNPALPVPTRWQSRGYEGAGPSNRSGGGHHGLSVAYDGLSLFPETAGTISGTVKVFPLQN